MQLDEIKLIPHFKIMFFLVKENLAFTKYDKLIDLFKYFEIELNSHY